MDAPTPTRRSSLRPRTSLGHVVPAPSPPASRADPFASGQSRFLPPPTCLQQLRTRTLLLRLLPPELVLLILDLAQYYHRTTVATSQYMDIAGRKVVYLWADVKDPRRARSEEIRLGTKSRDQGWSDEEGEYKGTYQASSSFFETLIAPTSSLIFNRFPSLPTDILHLERFQYNLHALPKAVTHLNTFIRPSRPEPEHGKRGLVQAATDAARRLGEEGRGETASVAIVVGAEYEGWQNRVSEARIDLMYSYFHPPNLSS